MIRAVDDPDRTRAMGTRARDWVEKDFERNHVWSQLDNYYRSAATQLTEDIT